MDFSLIDRRPSVDEYMMARSTVEWGVLTKEQVIKVLNKDAHHVIGLVNNEFAGLGRAIGDGMYFYIQDLIVMPKFQKSGLGGGILQSLIDRVHTENGQSVFIGLMAAEKTQGFYEKYGFKARKSSAPGMYLFK